MYALNKKKYSRFRHGLHGLVTALAILCAVNPWPQHAHASALPPVTLEIRQAVGAQETSALHSVTFPYALTALTDHAPMPPDSEAEGFAFTIAGDGAAQIALPLHSPGLYMYQVESTALHSAQYHIDRQVYVVEVYVVQGQPPMAVVYAEDGHKATGILFSHNTKNSATETAYTDDAPDLLEVYETPDPPPAPKDADTDAAAQGQAGAAAANTTGARETLEEHSPKTGDDSNPILWAAILCISGVSLVLLIFFGLRRQRKEGHRQ